MSQSIDQTTIDHDTATRIRDVYGDVPSVLVEGLVRIFASNERTPTSSPSPDSSQSTLWDHRDVVLITYADQVRSSSESTLAALRRFLVDRGLENLLACVHLLPFCPSTSDDGFSVSDYLQVDSDFGDWDDIRELGSHFDLMYDLVLNHSSQSHEWFQGFLRDEPKFREYYFEANPELDLSAVVRPRSLPLLTELQSSTGPRHVWTTFSADQVDLNYANPSVMLSMLETFVEYALRGARIIRLDAIAFLWKEVGTSCIHLPQTHAAVRLMRHVLERVVPGTIVLTETNVPHAENLSYFGNGDDEAHMVYQFSLPPLLLDAIHSGDTGVLRDWMASLRLPSEQTTFFNFTASHDGIGVRPVEGLVPPERVQALVDVVREHGGRVSMRAQSDGSESPYELNITYLDAVANRQVVSTEEHAKRFLATQAIMLSMQGIPAVYFHSLVGSPNDNEAVEASGINRRINRHKYDRVELDAALTPPDSLQRLVFDGYCHLLRVRRNHAAFAPMASQEVLSLPTDGLIGLVRRAKDGQVITVLANLGERSREVDPEQLSMQVTHDVLTNERLNAGDAVKISPFQVRWLT